MDDRSPWDGKLYQRKTLKECEAQISTLTKENFLLKFKIYNQKIEGNIQQMNALSESDDNASVASLSAEVEQLKKELTNKHLLLWQSKQAIEFVEKSFKEHTSNCHKGQDLIEDRDSPHAKKSLPELEGCTQAGTSQVKEAPQYKKMEIKRLQELSRCKLKIHQLELSLKTANRDKRNLEIALDKAKRKIKTLRKEKVPIGRVQTVRGLNGTQSAPDLNGGTSARSLDQSQHDTEDAESSDDFQPNSIILEKYFRLTRETIPQVFSKMKAMNLENIKLKREVELDRVFNRGDASDEVNRFTASEVIRLYFNNFKNQEVDYTAQLRYPQNEFINYFSSGGLHYHNSYSRAKTNWCSIHFK